MEDRKLYAWQLEMCEWEWRAQGISMEVMVEEVMMNQNPEGK